MEICIQTNPLAARFGFDEACRMIAEAGFTAIDWGIDNAWRFDDLLTAPTLSGLCIFEKSPAEVLAHYAEELASLQRWGLTVSQAHAPFRAFDFRRKEVLDYAIEIYKGCIRLCQAAGCKHLVIHGISIREEDTETTPELCRQYNRRLYESLLPTLAETDVVVCMENLFSRAGRMGIPNFTAAHCADPDEAVAWIDELNKQAGRAAFALCFDTGHLHLLRGDLRRYLSVLGDRIACLHIHDNDQFGDYHLLPYTGTFPWELFLATLKEIGYRGDLSFETCGQMAARRCPDPLVPHVLRLVYETGVYFRAELAR